jgi:hypothetical protein
MYVSLSVLLLLIKFYVKQTSCSSKASVVHLLHSLLFLRVTSQQTSCSNKAASFISSVLLNRLFGHSCWTPAAVWAQTGVVQGLSRWMTLSFPYHWRTCHEHTDTLRWCKKHDGTNPHGRQVSSRCRTVTGINAGGSSKSPGITSSCRTGGAISTLIWSRHYFPL